MRVFVCVFARLPCGYAAAIAGKCQVMELEAELIDRHTKRDSLILSAVIAQLRGPDTTSYTATPSSCQVTCMEGVSGTMCVSGLDGKQVTTELEVKECEGVVFVLCKNIT